MPVGSTSAWVSFDLLIKQANWIAKYYQAPTCRKFGCGVWHRRWLGGAMAADNLDVSLVVSEGDLCWWVTREVRAPWLPAGCLLDLTPPCDFTGRWLRQRFGPSRTLPRATPAPKHSESLKAPMLCFCNS